MACPVNKTTITNGIISDITTRLEDSYMFTQSEGYFHVKTLQSNYKDVVKSINDLYKEELVVETSNYDMPIYAIQDPSDRLIDMYLQSITPIENQAPQIGEHIIYDGIEYIVKYSSTSGSELYARNFDREDRELIFAEDGQSGEDIRNTLDQMPVYDLDPPTLNDFEVGGITPIFGIPLSALLEKGFERTGKYTDPYKDVVDDLSFQLTSASNITPEDRATEKTIRDLAAAMSHRIGIPFKIINDPEEKYKGKIDHGGKAVINLAYASADTPIHEILAHPIVRALKEIGNSDEEVEAYNTAMEEYWTANPMADRKQVIAYMRENYKPARTNQLYQNLVKELEYGRGKEVLDRIKRDYSSETKEPTEIKFLYSNPSTGDNWKERVWKKIGDKWKEGEIEIHPSNIKEILSNPREGYSVISTNAPKAYTLEEQQEEAIVELLGLMTAEKLDKVKDGKLISLLKRLLREVKEFVRAILRQREIEVQSLPENMTIGDISDILAYSNSKLLLPGYEVVYTTPDNHVFSAYQEASNHISNLAKSSEDIDVSNVTLQYELSEEELHTLQQVKESRAKLQAYKDSQEYQDKKNAELEKLNKELDDILTKEIVFHKQEVYLGIAESRKYGFDEYDYVRTESTYSRGNTSFVEDLGADYEGYYIHGYNTGREPSTKILKITKEQAEEIWASQDRVDKFEVEDHQQIYRLQEKIYATRNDNTINYQLKDLDRAILNIQGGEQSIQGFIKKNEEYEQAKLVIDQWKKLNNIVYNPEEVYSRGQEFLSVVGAYSEFDLDLMLQNLLFHIEDNQKAGGEFTISAFTKPATRVIEHLEDGSKIKIKIYPQSEDIKWAANSDVYSGSVWDAALKIDKNRKSELLGVSYSKYPSISNLEAIQPNLADIIDKLGWHHNELGISLTGKNFRLEYDETIPVKSRKIVDSINSILDQKYGKLIRPKIEANKRPDLSHVERIYDENSEDFIYTIVTNTGSYFGSFNTEEEANDALNRSQALPPAKTRKDLAKSLNELKDTLFYDSLLNIVRDEGGKIISARIPGKDGSIDSLLSFQNGKYYYEPYDYSTLGDPDPTLEITEEFYNNIISKFNTEERKELTDQALVNKKVAKLKEVAKKYPRTLIRSEVKKISDYDSSMYDYEELPFQRIPGSNTLLDEAMSYASDIKGAYSASFQAAPEEFLREIASQAHSSPSERSGAVKTVGERIVSVAERMFPDTSSEEKEDLFSDDPIIIADSKVNPASKSTRAGELTKRKVLNFLRNIGFTNIQEVSKLVHNGVALEDDAYVDLVNGVMQYVKGTEDFVLPEESMHILVELIQQNDNVLFRSMEKDIINYQIYRDTLADYQGIAAYQKADGSPDYNKIKKEAIAKLLAEYLIGSSENIETKIHLIKANTWWKQILDWIQRVFGKYENPFQQALERVEQENSTFGMFDQLRPIDALFLSATTKSVEERDEDYKATKAMFENIRDKAGKEGITKVDDQYYKDGKKWSYSKKDLEAMPHDELVLIGKELKLKNPSTDKPALIRAIRYKQARKRVSDLVDQFYQELFRNRPLDPADEPYYNKTAKDGKVIHMLLEDSFRTLIDNATGLLRVDKLPLNTALHTTPAEAKIAKKLDDFAKAFLSSFPEGTRFLAETIVKSESLLGTIDFLAIEPTGAVNIYDWKSMLLQGMEGAKDYKKQGINIQLQQYRKLLTEEYDVKEFNKIRATPVGRIYSKEENRMDRTLLDVDIVTPDPDILPERHLRDIISDEEITDDENRDEVIKRLKDIYERFVEFVKAGDTSSRQVLQEINDALYELQTTQGLKGLSIFINDTVAKADILLKKMKEEKNFNPDTIDELLASVSLYREIFNALDFARLLTVDKAVDAAEKELFDKKLLEYQSKTSQLDKEANRLLNEKATKHGIYTLLKPEAVVGWIPTNFRTMGSQNVATIQLLFELTREAHNKASLRSDEELKKLEELREKASQHAKAKGISFRDFMNKLINLKSGNLHSKIDSKFYELRDDVFARKDRREIQKFVKENYDLDAYTEWYNKKFNEEADFWREQTYSADPAEDAKIKKNKAYTFKQNYNIIEFPVTAFGSHNPFIWSKGIKTDLWESEGYKELKSDPVLLELYNHFIAKNQEAFEADIIEEWNINTFLPNVRKSVEDVLSTKGKSWMEKITDLAHTNYVNFKAQFAADDYQLNFGSRLDAGGNRIAKRFIPYTQRLNVEEKSLDLFTTYGLMVREIAKETYLKRNDEIARALLHIEANKYSFETNKFNKINMKAGVPQVNRAKGSEGKNLDLLNAYFRNIVLGESLQVEEDFVITFGIRKLWNKSPLGRIFGKVSEEGEVSVVKFLMYANNFNQKRVLGLNLSSAISNFLGGTFSAHKLYKKYLDNNDLLRSMAEITAGRFTTSETLKKKAALVDMFLPLLNNREDFKAAQLSVNNAATVLSQDWLMLPQRTSEEIVQLHVFYALLENTGVINNEIVNLREVAMQETGYLERFRETPAQQKVIEAEFEKKHKELKEKFGITKIAQFKEVTRNGKKEQIIEIPGVDRFSESAMRLRSIAQTMSKDALGSMDEYDLATYRFSVIGRLFMTFKNWIPRMADVRFGEFRKNQAHNSYEYGRFRMFGRALSANVAASIVKILPFTEAIGKQDFIKRAIEIYKEKQDLAKAMGSYDPKDFISEGEFVEMYIQGVNHVFSEFRTAFLLWGMFMSMLAIPDDDDTPEEKSAKKLIRRQIDKTMDEVAFFYNPGSIIDIAGQSFPIFSLIGNVRSLMTHTTQQFFGFGLEHLGYPELGIEKQDKAKPMKYLFKTAPVLKEIVTYIPTFDGELAKEWGIRLQDRRGR